MTKIKLVLLLILLFVGVKPGVAQNNPPDDNSISPVTIPNTETISISSKHTGGDYQIMVGLPEDYASSDAETRYSVVYLLDANYFFGAITDFIRVENLVQEISPLIIVGVGYPEKPLEGRVSDMLQNPDLFLEFIADELIPLIDKTYKTETRSLDRAIIGHSLGGQFVLYSLFNRPELFNRYVAASPGSPTWDTIIPLEANFAKQHSSLPVSLFMSSGEDEFSLSDIQTMFTTIQDRNYEGLELSFMPFAAASHGSSSIPAFTYGLRFVYRAKTTFI